MNLAAAARRFGTLALAVALAALGAACGPGEGGTGPVGASTQVGRIDGHGSTVIEGVAFDDRAAVVRLDENPLAATEVPVAELLLGAQGVLRADGAQVLEAQTAALVVGAIDADGVAADRRSITVLGQRIDLAGRAGMQPVLDGLRADDLAPGMAVEVHGQRLADDTVLATRVQRRSPQSLAYRLSGRVSEVDAAEALLRIGAARVHVGAATRLPAGSSLPAVGQAVTVYASRGPGPEGVLPASVLRIDSLPFSAGQALRVAGFVRDLAAAGQRFTVQGLAVEAAGATLTGVGALDELRADDAVRVSGTVELAGATLQLRAREVEVLRQPERPISASGTVSGFIDITRPWRLRGTTVRLVSQPRLVGGGAANLGNGVAVRVLGRIVQGELLASEVHWLPADTVVVGMVAGYDAATNRLAVPSQAAAVQLADSLIVRQGIRAELADGRRVRLLGALQGDTFVAQELQFLDGAAAAQPLVLVGVPSPPHAAGTRVFLNGSELVLRADTVVSGGPSGTQRDLDLGYLAVVHAVREGEELVAQRVHLQFNFRRNDSLVGRVSEYDGARARIAGQRVDLRLLSEPALIGRRSGLRNGALVLAQGTMGQGDMVAWRMMVLDD
jgi:hypothetical protein